MTPDKLKRLLVLIALRDPAAADEIDALAEELKKLAAELRAGTNPTRAVGGAATRVQMAVVGPDGRVKQTVDTGAVT